MLGTLVDLRILVKLTGASCFELDDGRAAGGVVEDEEQEDGATIPAGRCAVIRRLCRVRFLFCSVLEFGPDPTPPTPVSAVWGRAQFGRRCLRFSVSVPPRGATHTASGRACGVGPVRHSPLMSPHATPLSVSPRPVCGARWCVFIARKERYFPL